MILVHFSDHSEPKLLSVVTLPGPGPTMGLLTQVHVARPGITLLVTLATPQLHELYM